MYRFSTCIVSVCESSLSIALSRLVSFLYVYCLYVYNFSIFIVSTCIVSLFLLSLRVSFLYDYRCRIDTEIHTMGFAYGGIILNKGPIEIGHVHNIRSKLFWPEFSLITV